MIFVLAIGFEKISGTKQILDLLNQQGTGSFPCTLSSKSNTESDVENCKEFYSLTGGGQKHSMIW